MFEEIPLRRVASWTLFGAAAITVAGLLGLTYTTIGLLPVVFAYVILYVFRPVVTPRVTDAELEAWLNGG